MGLIPELTPSKPSKESQIDNYITHQTGTVLPVLCNSGINKNDSGIVKVSASKVIPRKTSAKI